MAKKQYTSEDSISKISQELNNDGTMKTLYGHAYFTNDNKLIQDQILVMPGGKIAENTVVLIDDVLEELLNGTKVKGSGKYFFVVITMTSVGDDGVEETVELECPGVQVFQLLFPDLEERLKKGTSEWAKYWSQKWDETAKNEKNFDTIQRQVINLPGTSWIDQTGNTQTITDKQIQNPSLGDIENLLSMF